MLLEKDFYAVKKISKLEDDKHIADIYLNQEHAIFKGHFPGNPVTPELA